MIIECVCRIGMEAVSVSKHKIYLTLSMLYSKKMRRKHGGLVGKVSVHLYCTEPVIMSSVQSR